MKKKKRKQRVVVTYVELAPSRRSTTPFCAYYGPHGEKCNTTKDLAWVWCIPGPPGALPMGYMACPEQYEHVGHAVETFFAGVLHPLRDKHNDPLN
jgi:hypothetical protein